ncbi:MAG: hypothetical protein L6R37_004056, partial [Teloschistes peruensis]
STIEGGAGAQIGYVPEEQNDWQGTYWSSWLAETRVIGILKPGGKFRVKLGSFDCGTFIGKRHLFQRAKPVLSSGDGSTRLITALLEAFFRPPTSWTTPGNLSRHDGSNRTTFTIDDEGAGNVWLLGWTRSENPILNVSVKAPPAPVTTIFASAAASSTGTRSNTAMTPTAKAVASGAGILGFGGFGDRGVRGAI